MYSSCSQNLQSALFKMSVKVCLQSDFNFVHHQQLSLHVKQLSTNDVLDAISSQSHYTGVSFTVNEANSLKAFLISSRYSPSSSRKNVLQNISIFSSASNSPQNLYSVSTAQSMSVVNQVIGEPEKCAFDITTLHSELILLSSAEYNQVQLLKSLNVSFVTDADLLVNYVFPLIRNGTISDHVIDKFMPQVLDSLQVLTLRNNKMVSHLQSLKFVKTVHGRKSPCDLLTPLDEDVQALYAGEDVFPIGPYNTSEKIYTLQLCGLHSKVTPQEILDIIYSISTTRSSQPQRVPQVNVNRAKKILQYISEPSFHQQITGKYVIANDRYRSYSFSDALKHLSTNWNWLPIESNRPSGYPAEIPWQGETLDSHVASLRSLIVVSHSSTMPCIVGSQSYIVCPSVSDHIATMLSSDTGMISQLVVAHFKEILNIQHLLSHYDLSSVVFQVYNYMNNHGGSYFRLLYSLPKWIYIKKEQKFMSTSVVALKQNPTFKHDLEPYIFTLPDSLTSYSRLFGSSSNIAPTVSQSQIVSVLKMIKNNVESGCQQSTAGDAWSTVMSILNWLTNNGNQTVSDDIDADQILVPIETQTECEWPQLVPVSEVVYTDNDFLKEYLKSLEEESEDEKSYQFIHSHISTNLAYHLGASSFSEFMEISEDTFEDAGQYEPLTTRLKNILRDYKDGLTIIKELLQNADDAEATEVNICYDTRQHEANPKKLFFSGMVNAHGPALIVHNDSTFSDEDFTNIAKLAGTTKANKVLKIGKFGIGFCSVYHITDVPSFISRDKLYIFDPTLCCLRKEIKNVAQPGKKIAFTNKVIAKSSQLMPYDGLFGFNRSNFQGTMFRLPFRTHPSELSSTCYSNSMVQELQKAILKSSSNLLLFLQHVKRITFQQINPGQSTPEVLLAVTREQVKTPVELPIGSLILELTCSNAQSSDSKSCHWLVSQKTDTSSTGEFYTASVTSPLGTPGIYKVDKEFEGEIFCFLPLSQRTGLPVHVSSNFAVINNRRGIWTSEDAISQADREVVWNVTLMEGVISEAYFLHLQACKDMMSNGDISNYSFHCLWPEENLLVQHNPWEKMIKKLYLLISGANLFYSDWNSEWQFLIDSKFLETKILCLSSSSSTPKCVLKIVQYLKVPVVDLPQNYYKYFELDALMVDENEFIHLFFKSIESLNHIYSERNYTIMYIMEQYMAIKDVLVAENLYSLLNSHCSVPCGREGKILRNFSEVIDPSSTFSDLFDDSECCFPLDILTQNDLTYAALKKLGMLTNTLPWSIVIERATTVPVLYESSPNKAMKRASLVILASTIEPFDHINCDDNLSKIPFLPVLPKPAGYILPWKGTNHGGLMCGKDLVAKSLVRDMNVDMCGSQNIFVNDASVDDGGCGPINDKAIKVLGIRQTPTFDEVVLHLSDLINLFSTEEHTSEMMQTSDKICRKVYEFLDSCLSKDKEVNISSLLKLACIWTGKHFVTPNVVAKTWKIEGPYLYPLPPSLSFRKSLTESMDIKEEFTLSDIQFALAQMKEDFGSEPISERCQIMLQNLFSLLASNDTPKKGTIFLPDENYVLFPANKLYFNDTPWAPKDSKYKYVHNIVRRDIAIKFGVIPMRTQFLERYCTKKKTHFPGSAFGQREDLTRRIQNILEGYPFDITVLKELLQNADDAKATKMYVILDKRTHGTESILSDAWIELQGPALLVWNDSEFSENDLKGIQELGLGSKRSDAETIGQYGIGFNVVYHLTDCPSFITGGETMCVFDPHCRYVLGADYQEPGRRYDNLTKDDFWTTFKDMQSVYLRSGLDNCPPELQEGGSLFRFPLRHTIEHVKMSEILKRDPSRKTEPLTPNDMHKNLKNWAPDMKEAMLFLNHVTELCFFVIAEKSSVLVTLNNYRTKVDQSAQDSRADLHKALSKFKDNATNFCSVVRYPLTITTVTQSKDYDEQWLIQQGVGDIENINQTWQYVSHIKPRHGLAAPIKLPLQKSRFSDSKQISSFGKVFCFLPLPIGSNLPVHINGHFVLDANRRELWHSTDPNHEDDKSAWNRKLFEAIASSYANFLEYAQQYCVPENVFESFSSAFECLERYYTLFPRPSAENLEKVYLSLVENVYAKLVKHNSPILSVVYNSGVGEQKIIKCKWCPVNSDQCSTQVYFWTSTSIEKEVVEYERKHIKPLLEALGMQLTAAPYRLQCYLNKAISEKTEKLQAITPSSVYIYYQNFNCQAITSAAAVKTFPCAIENTIFKRVEVFKRFIDYLLQPRKENNGNFTGMLFPGCSPFGYPLLLTADNLLRCFNEKNKVLRSKYSRLFGSMQHLFLNLKLFATKYGSEYFAANSDIEQLVKHILGNELPSELQATKVKHSVESLSKKRLASLWECFSSDYAFKSCLDTTLRQWALIPSSDGYLYSTSSKVLPVYPLQQASTSNITPLVAASVSDPEKVFAAIHMPFVDMTIMASNVLLPCPDLANPLAILQNLYHLNQEVPLSELLTKEMVSVIINFLKIIDFRNDQISLKYIKSLPLFETVNGSFCSIEGKPAFQWNNSVSSAGYNKWIKCYNIIFLRPSGAWAHIGTEQLKISDIEGEKIYSEYIFKVFDSINKADRYSQLTHIKDYLFQKNFTNSRKHMRQYSDTQMYYVLAKEFLDELKNLPCIGEDNEPLKPIRNFYDHTLPIFTIFPKKYKFLPPFFTDDDRVWSKWEKFCKYLGLRHVLSKREFLSLCEYTASVHEDPQKASKVLLDHFFSVEVIKEGWTDDSHFNQKMSNIVFVPAEQLPELNWIKSPYRFTESGRRIYSRDGRVVELTKLSGTALPNHQNCLWTIKPILSLPLHDISKAIKKILARLDVGIEPTLQQVVTNLKNLSSMDKFTNLKLFDKYSDSNQPPEFGDGLGLSATSLVEVICSHFAFLQKCLSMSIGYAEQLQNISCIPVPSTALKKNTPSWQVVLVKPCYVVSCPVFDFHPFLHSVPKICEQYVGLLQKIGVCGVLGINHCQLLLRTAFEQSDGQRLDENTKACVVKAIKLLYEIMCKTSNSEEVCVPLYLPSTNWTLVLSTNLLYQDASRFFGHVMETKLENTSYTLVMLKKADYDFSEKEFCDLLPECVKPVGLSKICDQRILPAYKLPVEPNAVHKALEKTLQMKKELPRAISAILLYQTKFKPQKLIDEFTEFIGNIDVITVQKVRTLISFRDTGTPLGELDLSFHLQQEHERWILYLEMQPESVILLKENIIRSLSRQLIEIIKQYNPSLDSRHLSVLIGHYSLLLRLETPADISKTLEVEAIPYTAGNDYNVPITKPTYTIGEEIPLDWHHRLDQAIDNVFHPEELVGYEDRENHIIYARILYPVLPEDGKLDSVQRVDRKFRILKNSLEEEGIEVGILELYKFMKGLKPVKPVDKDEKSIVPFEGESDPIRLHKIYQEKDLEDVISDLKKQLDYIWKLSEENRKKAIKRLYLKWHPDKNPDNQVFAEKVFKFLNSEIEKRKSETFDRDDLNDTARRHRTNLYRERHYYNHTFHQYRSSSDSTKAKSTSHDSKSKFGNSGWGSMPSEEPDPFGAETVRPQKNPNEGKCWFKQACANFDSLLTLLDNAKDKPQLCGDVCFTAHQVAEKALKGGKYFVCGLDPSSLANHNISTHAYGLQSELPGETHGLVSHTTPLENYYLEPRYPNRWGPGTVPADMYTYEQAKQAKDHAEAILKIIQKIQE